MKENSPKERVLKAATVLFHQNGYHSTGINTIISEAKVAKASFYDHYKTKDDLAAAYLEARHIYWFEGLNREVAKAKANNEKVIKAFEYILLMNVKENYQGCAFINMLAELVEHTGVIYEIIESHKAGLRIYFEELIEDKQKAFMVYMLFEACLVESQVSQSSACVEQTIELLKQQL